ncbi:MAG TPA: hypothetical protein VJJ76_02420 [archaeon]|uniref:Uncharacterized protein n=1 Tax=Candidatus Wolfebacteria bacterium RIFCSPLOWO2_01_FULL_47_17b TaxID=1802558 RepID=A0A1F8DZV3_9BACT|nr:MAG: hypothetical protein A2935_03735 [Candidatus Wolfebacteria bacterium RIFCSPLOWO2_01_FULL_47_17b]HLC39713.1 hypothetical protein [archaeon]
MNYDLRFDVCKKLRELENGKGYEKESADGLKNILRSSQEFSKDEIIYLNSEIDKIVKKANTNTDDTLSKYLPYAAAFVAGYGARWLQDKAGEWIEEGEHMAQKELAAKISF